MKKIKTYKGWKIYQATKKEDEYTLEHCKYGAYLPEQSPDTLDEPNFCSDSINELVDIIKYYDK